MRGGDRQQEQQVETADNGTSHPLHKHMLARDLREGKRSFASRLNSKACRPVPRLRQRRQIVGSRSQTDDRSQFGRNKASFAVAVRAEVRVIDAANPMNAGL